MRAAKWLLLSGFLLPLLIKPLGKKYHRWYTYLFQPKLFLEHSRYLCKINQIEEDLSAYALETESVSGCSKETIDFAPKVLFWLNIFYEDHVFKKIKKRQIPWYPEGHTISRKAYIDKLVYWEWTFSPLFKKRYKNSCLQAIIKETRLPIELSKIIVLYLPGPRNCLEEASLYPIANTLFVHTPIGFKLSLVIVGYLDQAYESYVTYRETQYHLKICLRSQEVINPTQNPYLFKLIPLIERVFGGQNKELI